MKNRNINKTLFFYYTIKTDNALQIIDKKNELYFNSLLINYFGEFIPKIQNKQDFLSTLQNDINNLLQIDFATNVTVILDKSISSSLNSKYFGKEIEFILNFEDNNFHLKSIIFENVVRNI